MWCAFGIKYLEIQNCVIQQHNLIQKCKFNYQQLPVNNCGMDFYFDALKKKKKTWFMHNPHWTLMNLDLVSAQEAHMHGQLLSPHWWPHPQQHRCLCMCMWETEQLSMCSPASVHTSRSWTQAMHMALRTHLLVVCLITHKHTHIYLSLLPLLRCVI